MLCFVILTSVQRQQRHSPHRDSLNHYLFPLNSLLLVFLLFYCDGAAFVKCFGATFISDWPVLVVKSRKCASELLHVFEIIREPAIYDQCVVLCKIQLLSAFYSSFLFELFSVIIR